MMEAPETARGCPQVHLLLLRQLLEPRLIWASQWPAISQMFFAPSGATLALGRTAAQDNG